MSTAEKQPSILLQRADAVHRCIKELERENHQIKDISITDNHAVVMLKTTHGCKKLLARESGTINTPTGRFTVMQLKLFGVYVQWLRPFFVVDARSTRAH
jgi:hypothetical protein